MKNKTYTASGFIFELGIQIDSMPNRFEIWNETFNNLNHTEVMNSIYAQIEAEGKKVSEQYLARPRGAASHNANTEQWQTREIRYTVAKLVGFAERAGFNVSKLI